MHHASTPATLADTKLIYPRKMEGWVDLYTEKDWLTADSRLS